MGIESPARFWSTGIHFALSALAGLAFAAGVGPWRGGGTLPLPTASTAAPTPVLVAAATDGLPVAQPLAVVVEPLVLAPGEGRPPRPQDSHTKPDRRPAPATAVGTPSAPGASADTASPRKGVANASCVADSIRRLGPRGTRRRQLRAGEKTFHEIRRRWGAWQKRSPQQVEMDSRDRVEHLRFFDMVEVIFDCPGCRDFSKLRTQLGPGLVQDRRLLWESDTHIVKVVLGVVSATRHCSLRNLHRSTWMQYKHVCDIKDFAKQECEVFPMFVLAGVGQDEIESSGDMVRLMSVPPAPQETPSDGYVFRRHAEMWLESNLKTVPWFEHATKQYPWATHVGKMDLDTLPDIAVIHAILARAPQRGVHYGRRIASDGQGGFKGVGCMYGEFYLVTADLVPCWLTEAHRMDSEFRDIPEDQVFGAAMVKAVNRGTCNATELSSRGKPWWHQR